MDYFKCMTEADHPKKCVDYMEDYFECLHHRKEIGRYNKIAAEYKKQQDAKKAEEQGSWFSGLFGGGGGGGK